MKQEMTKVSHKCWKDANSSRPRGTHQPAKSLSKLLSLVLVVPLSNFASTRRSWAHQSGENCFSVSFAFLLSKSAAGGISPPAIVGITKHVSHFLRRVTVQKMQAICFSVLLSLTCSYGGSLCAGMSRETKYRAWELPSCFKSRLLDSF